MDRATNLLDIRRIIGGLLGVYGVILLLAGIFGSDAEKNKAAGLNINLYVGIAPDRGLGAVLVLGALPPAHRGAQRSRAPGPGRTLIAPSGRTELGREQREHEPPKPPPMIRAAKRGRVHARRDRALDLRNRHLVVVAQTRVRRVQQRAELRGLAALQRRHRRVHALVLADHVAQARVERGGQARGVVGVPERLEAEQLERSAALPRDARCSPMPPDSRGAPESSAAST